MEKQRQVVLGVCAALGPRFAATRCQIARRPSPDTEAAMCSFGLYAKPVTGLLHTESGRHGVFPPDGRMHLRDTGGLSSLTSGQQLQVSLQEVRDGLTTRAPVDASHLWGSDTWLFRLYRGCPPAEAPEALRSQNFRLHPTAPLALALGCTSTVAMEPSAENARWETCMGTPGSSAADASRVFVDAGFRWPTCTVHPETFGFPTTMQ